MRDQDKTNEQLIAELKELRSQVEDTLHLSEQKLALHFQQMPLGAIEWDLDFKVTRWNPGAEKVFGYWDGLQREDNPFDPEEQPKEHQSWLDGWYKAREHDFDESER